MSSKNKATPSATSHCDYAQYREIVDAERVKNKFLSKPRTIDGIRFASQKEANRYCELKLLEKAGKIKRLKCHPYFNLNANGIKITSYTADFIYDEKGEQVVEDVKSTATKTEVYKIKKAWMAAQYGIEIRET